MLSLSVPDNNMSKKVHGNKKRRKRTFLHNLPEYIMYVLGSIIMAFFGILFLIAYVVYGFLSTLWYMRFVCTYCPHFDKIKCPSGYSIIAGKLFKKRDASKFEIMFKRHMGSVILSWFAPVIAGIYILINKVSIVMIILLVVFILDAFIILPWVSRKYGCNYCDLSDRCPWMGRYGK